MRLYLAQHGNAVDRQDDPKRPLSRAGRGDIRYVAQQLADAGVQVARVWHSGRLRARETAMLFAKQLLVAGRPEQIDGIAPNDPVEEFAADADVWQEDTMVVGHLPFMARLVSLLLAGDAERAMVQYIPGSVVCLERISQDRWVIVRMLRPDLRNSETQG